MEIVPKKVEALLAEICVELGCCIPPLDATRLAGNPPRDVETFTDAVLEAEVCDDLRVRRQLRERIADHFRRWEDEAMQTDLIDELSRYSPKPPET